MTTLEEIIAHGQTAYEATLPDYLQRGADKEAAPTRIHIFISPERQREICLNCPLIECVGIEHRNCPIRIEQRREWREQNRRRI